jgi:hypothetical protein
MSSIIARTRLAASPKYSAPPSKFDLIASHRLGFPPAITAREPDNAARVVPVREIRPECQ